MTDGKFEGYFHKQYPYPHCNTEVLHAPGECYYCDHYPERQAARAASGTPFTPNEANGWSGNIAVKEGEIHQHLGAPYVVGAAPPPRPPLTPWQRFLRWIYDSWGGQ